MLSSPERCRGQGWPCLGSVRLLEPPILSDGLVSGRNPRGYRRPVACRGRSGSRAGQVFVVVPISRVRLLRAKHRTVLLKHLGDRRSVMSLRVPQRRTRVDEAAAVHAARDRNPRTRMLCPSDVLPSRAGIRSQRVRQTRSSASTLPRPRPQQRIRLSP